MGHLLSSQKRQSSKLASPIIAASPTQLQRHVSVTKDTETRTSYLSTLVSLTREGDG
jgi:hypothetical protein